MNEITLNQLQQRVDGWIKNIGKGYFSELTNMILLSEEVGELARVIARVYGDQVPKKGDLTETPRQKIAEELADIIWVATCLANQTGVDLTQAVEDSFRKKTLRDKDRFQDSTI